MLIILILAVMILFIVVFTVFFDHAVLVRRGTIYHVDKTVKVVALTFDDGPSPKWTPQILDELKKAGAKATFFMLGEHVEKYPDIARRVASEGHEIENHTYDHHVLIYYKPSELEKQIKDTERIIKEVTGQQTQYLRPPKAWLIGREKRQIGAMGYKVVLWTLNAKDWVNFDDKYIVGHILSRVKPGDIILMHDSGGVWGAEGGRRKQTVKTVPKLIEGLRNKGYSFVTMKELLAETDGK